MVNETQQTPNLKTLAPAIAKALGWTVKKQADDVTWYAQLLGPDNAAIGININTKEGRLHVSGVFNDRDARGKQFWYVPYGKSTPSMNVSLTKTAAQIAKDIQRRLLPEYLELLALMNRAWEETCAHRGAVGGAAEKLAKLLGAVVDYRNPQNPRIALYHCTALPEQSGDLQFSDPENVVIDIGVTPAEALAMFKALIAFRKETK